MRKKSDASYTFSDSAQLFMVLPRKGSNPKQERRPSIKCPVCKKHLYHVWRADVKNDKGHSFYASVSNVCIQKSGCPVCSGRQVLTGYNDLATRYPEIANEWDDEKNFPLSAGTVMPGSQKVYWWKSSRGHSYQATPNMRTAMNTGCPYCSGRNALVGFNDLATIAHEVAKNWDYERNEPLVPTDVTIGSSKVIWWKCEKDHSWKKKIGSQVKYNYCPICRDRKRGPGSNN